MKPRNICMVQCCNAGTTYWRMYSWWEAMHRTGKANCHVLGWDKNESSLAQWQIDIADPTNQPRLFGMLYSAGVQADIIVWQRLHTRESLAAFHAMRDQFPDKPFLSEIDDDITDVASYNPAASTLCPGSPLRDIALSQFRDSDGLIVTTPYLQESYSEFSDNIYVVPNSIDFHRWTGKKRKKPGLRIGWIGATSHAEDLMLLENVIPKVLAQDDEVKFVFCSNDFPEFLQKLEGPRVELARRWFPILQYPKAVMDLDFDIGLAPLRDNKFNRAKSNLRWLEYSACSVPTIASNVGHFSSTLNSGDDGWLVNSEDQWVKAILTLSKDRKARKEMGRSAHNRVEKDFNIDKNVDIYLSAVEDAISRPVKKAPGMLNGVDDIEDVIKEMEKEPEPIPGFEIGPLEIMK